MLLPLLLATNALAWEVQHAPGGAELGWGAMPVDYEVVTDERLGGAALEAVHEAFRAWSSIEDSDAHFVGHESDKGPREASFDATHSVFIDDAWPYGDEVLALAATWADPDSGELLHFDLRLNGNLSWGAGEHGGYDLQSAVTHEVGHVLGLDHTSEREAAMFAELAEGEVRQELHYDDVDAIRYLYPPGMNEEDGGSGLPMTCSHSPGAPIAWLVLLAPLALRRQR